MERYNSLYEEFKTRYPKRPDIQLQAILEHTEQALANRDWRMTAFASKLFTLDRKWIGKYFLHIY